MFQDIAQDSRTLQNKVLHHGNYRFIWNVFIHYGGLHGRICFIDEITVNDRVRILSRFKAVYITNLDFSVITCFMLSLLSR